MMYNLFKKKDIHTPEPERKYGLYAISYYVTGGIVAFVWIAIIGWLFEFSFSPISNVIEHLQNQADDFLEFEPIAAFMNGAGDFIFGVAWLAFAAFFILLSFYIMVSIFCFFTKNKTLHKKIETLPDAYMNCLGFACAWLAMALIGISISFVISLFKDGSIFNESLNFSELHYSTFSMFFLFASLFLFVAWFLLGSKLSIIRKPSFMPNHMYIGGFALFAVYLLTLNNYSDVNIYQNLFIAVLLFLPPLLFVTVPVYAMLGIEMFKETTWYQETILEGRGKETNRLGGFLTYIRRDISPWFQASKYEIIRTKESPIYLGKTRWQYDYKLGGRDIGLISDQHLITVAGSGAGKSTTSIYNNILTYNGGLIAFDTKCEHLRNSYKRRKAYAPVYVLDPYQKNDQGINTDYWNPLDEIDLESKTARSDLNRICSAIIPEKKGSDERDAHFREIPKIIIRGYIAHILTTYPKEKQHLGTLYDLFVKGDPDGEEFDPKAVESVINDMEKNNALGGAPSQASAILAVLSERERSTHYTSINRAIDWMNDDVMRSLVTKTSTFSVRDCKTKDASVFIILPEKQIYEMSRFLTLFYTVALDTLDENETPQPEGSSRRVLFLFDEFEALGSFEPARQAALRKRGSNLKMWFILQNYHQLETNYENLQDFFGNADKQFFGIDKSDTKMMEIIKKALGTYTREVWNSRANKMEKYTNPVMTEGRLNKILNGDRNTQIIIPVNGAPMVLKRVPFWENFGRGLKNKP